MLNLVVCKVTARLLKVKTLLLFSRNFTNAPKKKCFTLYRKLYLNQEVTAHRLHDWVQTQAGIDILLLPMIYIYTHPTSYPVDSRGDSSVSKYECTVS
jgi:hypothetical protein